MLNRTETHRALLLQPYIYACRLCPALDLINLCWGAKAKAGSKGGLWDGSPAVGSRIKAPVCDMRDEVPHKLKHFRAYETRTVLYIILQLYSFNMFYMESMGFTCDPPNSSYWSSVSGQLCLLTLTPLTNPA